MKILHLETAKEWRGGQQQIAYLVQGLVRHKIPTVLLCPKNSELHRRFEHQKLPVQAFPIGHHLSVKTARKIARFARENGYDLLHVHSSHALSLGLLVKTLRPSLKLVASRRVDFPVKKPVIRSLKYNNPLIDRVVCVSRNIANVLRRDGVNEHRLTVIHSGVDLHRLDCAPSHGDNEHLKQALGIPIDHLVVGTVAALVGHKDYPTLLRAAAQVCSKFGKVSFVAVGEGNDRPQLEALTRELGVENCFKFVGFQKNPGEYYRLFDVFVLASRKEGLGTSVLDAQACGVPVVATKAGGIPEMITHLKNGYLVAPQAPDELAEGILKLLKDPTLRQTLAEQAQKTVKDFSIEQTVKKHIALYQEILSEA